MFDENELLQEIEQKHILNEMYFGKTASLLKLEELFNKFKISYSKENPMQNGATYKQIIKDPILTKIGDTIAEQFGFNEVIVTIAKDDRINAYTVSFPSDAKGNSYNASEKPFTSEQLNGAVIITNSGFFYDKKKFKTNLLVCLNLGILFRTNISTNELIAILLHEIGHNFTKTIINAKKLNGRMDEKFADQFVAMYGYGPDLVSGFSKMTINYGPVEKTLKDVPIVNIVVGLNHIWDNLVFRTAYDDPHPNMYSRMESQIKQLESELRNNKELTPKAKAEIQRQIDLCKDIINKSLDGSKDGMADRMVKYYYREMEPNLDIEQEKNKFADKYTAPDNINKKVEEIYKRKQKNRFI